MGFNTFPCNPYPISTDELNKGNNDELNTRVTALEGDVSDLEEQKANQITIALSFNPETTYNPGDLVYYNGLTYRCTNEHTGEWDADDFAVTTIANELNELKSGLTDKTVLIKTINGTTTASGALSTDLDQQYYTILGARSLNTNMFGFNRGDAYLTVFEVVNGVWGLAAEKSASFEVYYIKRPTS